MKLLIAFALFAVAFADEVRDEIHVVPLPLSPLFSRPSMGQVIIPNYVIDAIKVGTPVMRDEAIDANDDDGLRVIFVDSRLDADVNPSEAVEVFEAPEPITLGEASLPAFETADIVPEAVKIVDSPVDVAPVAEEIVPEAVRFVDSPVDVAPVAEEIIPEAVKFVDSPVDAAPVAEEIAPEPVQIAEAPLPAYEVADVNAEESDHALLDDAPVAEEIVPEPVHFVEVAEPALDTAEIIYGVNFVDGPLDVAPEAVKIAEPVLPEVSPVAEEIVPEPVLIAEAAEDVDAARFDDAPLLVEPVKIAVPQYRDYRGKQFNDPRLRSV